MNGKIEKIYEKLCVTSVFGEVLKTPLFGAFFAFCESQGAEKRRAYARFVGLVYEGGGNLTELTYRLVCEDENAYVRTAARGVQPNVKMEAAAKRELAVFSEFGALALGDFASALNERAENLPAFDSFVKDMVGAYGQRIGAIDKYGYGVFSSHGMFRLSDERTIEPIISADKSGLTNFIGYEAEREKIVENTLAFLEGGPAANTLLCGDAGTGKSSTVKAIANEFFEKGLRLIELRKDQLRYLPLVMGRIEGNPLKFIIFVDDLSFAAAGDDFGTLKAALEGSASARADNAVIYATSNRRHIVKERFSDRDGDDVHQNDTLQETLSLADRFGLTVLYQKPDKRLYLKIARELARRKGVEVGESFDVEAEAFALRKGNRSARCAGQFVESILRRK
ncbi:MAG: DUF815 domain-containing protein [Clostridia bacterium]|nr:DUF815 domain-containing protein [Clostridia bacterium]